MAQVGNCRYAAVMANASLAGRWYLASIGIMLALAGGVFCWLMWRSFERAHQMRAWPDVPCVVLTSKAEERQIDASTPMEFRFSVHYGYEWSGKEYTGYHYTWRGSPWTSRKEDVEELVKQFEPGTRLTCKVDPTNPDFAVLKTDSQAPAYSIWFPALFVVGGLGIAVRAFARR